MAFPHQPSSEYSARDLIIRDGVPHAVDVIISENGGFNIIGWHLSKSRRKAVRNTYHSVLPLITASFASNIKE